MGIKCGFYYIFKTERITVKTIYILCALQLSFSSKVSAKYCGVLFLHTSAILACTQFSSTSQKIAVITFTFLTENCVLVLWKGVRWDSNLICLCNSTKEVIILEHSSKVHLTGCIHTFYSRLNSLCII